MSRKQKRRSSLKAAATGNDARGPMSDIEKRLGVTNPGVGLTLLIACYGVALFLSPFLLLFIFRGL